MPGRIFFPLVFVIIGVLSFSVYKTRGKGNEMLNTGLRVLLVLFIIALVALGLWLADFTSNYTF